MLLPPRLEEEEEEDLRPQHSGTLWMELGPSSPFLSLGGWQKHRAVGNLELLHHSLFPGKMLSWMGMSWLNPFLLLEVVCLGPFAPALFSLETGRERASCIPAWHWGDVASLYPTSQGERRIWVVRTPLEQNWGHPNPSLTGGEDGDSVPDRTEGQLL